MRYDTAVPPCLFFFNHVFFLFLHFIHVTSFSVAALRIFLLNRLWNLFADLHGTQTLWNRPGQAQRVREPGDEQGTKRSVCLCLFVCVWSLCWYLTHLPRLPFPQENLRHYVDRIFNVITTSGIRCPTVMCDIFFSLRESAATRFQGNSPTERLAGDGRMKASC